ncbi:LysR family transcriptional regulator [Pseudomonas putida]|uniref:LysR family transcriptional regulator n=1 Tax=Pseudomonas putida TaxID=303 RepID=UPI002DC03C1F|nr:LysR family transcriptional regulator [Pseudomonas putida]WRW04771.1 LysR family transcriptional regulator [Pseudomonas putida]
MSAELDNKIRNFLCISLHGSISKASEQLDISQPSLSRQLASLEAYIGQPLFKRTGRGLSLTDAGTQLASAAAPAFMSIDSAVSQLRDVYGATQGNLRLATVHTLTYYFLGEVVSRFVHDYEDVNVSFMARSSTEVVKVVESGTAQVGFVYDSEVASADLTSTHLFNEKMAIVTRQDDPLLRRSIDLAAYPLRLVVFSAGYALRRMLDVSGFPYIVAAEVETVDAMLELVSSGMGACILPALIPDRVLNQYGLARSVDYTPTLSRKVVAIQRTDAVPRAMTRALLDIAVETAGGLG